MSDEQAGEGEFRRAFRLDELDKGEKTLKLTANEAECDALASRLELAAVSSLEASLKVRREEAGVYGVTGSFEAEIAVLVEGEETALDFTVGEPVEETYASEEGWEALEARSLDGEVDAERVEGESVDLGELIAQSLSLALDPILFEAGALEEGAVAYSSDPDGGADSAHPFAALAALRREKSEE